MHVLVDLNVQKWGVLFIFLAVTWQLSAVLLLFVLIMSQRCTFCYKVTFRRGWERLSICCGCADLCTKPARSKETLLEPAV